MSRAVRRWLAAALRPNPRARWWETTAIIGLPESFTRTAPLWSPEPGYLEVLTATVWARPCGTGIAHAIVVVAGAEPGARVIKSGPVAPVDVVRWGGLADKPHRISWLAHVPPVTWRLDTGHPALSYQDWFWASADDLDSHYRQLLRARHLHANQVRLRATPAGRFQATVAIEIETGAFRRYDITAHAAALSAVARRLGPGTRLRFHPAAAEHSPIHCHTTPGACWHHRKRRPGSTQPHQRRQGRPSMTNETDAPITGAAVTFDPAALRSWLHQPADDGSDRADDVEIGDLFSRAHGGLLAGLDGLLAALADDDTQIVWRLRPGVQYVGFFRTFDGDGCDGAIIVADLDSSLRLASLHQDPRDFASRESHGVTAAIEALTHLAAMANHIVGQCQLSHDVAEHNKQAGAGDIAAVLNAVADDLLEVADAGDEGLRDALNLTVNAIPVYLEHGWVGADPAAARDRLELVAASGYDEDLDTILGWIDAGIR